MVLFKCDWYDVHNPAGIKTDDFGFTLVNFCRVIHTGKEKRHDPFVFSCQVEQVFYVEDPKSKGWHTVIRKRPRDAFDMGIEEPSDMGIEEPCADSRAYATPPGRPAWASKTDAAMSLTGSSLDSPTA